MRAPLRFNAVLILSFIVFALIFTSIFACFFACFYFYDLLLGSIAEQRYAVANSVCEVFFVAYENKRALIT